MWNVTEAARSPKGDTFMWSVSEAATLHMNVSFWGSSTPRTPAGGVEQSALLL